MLAAFREAETAASKLLKKEKKAKEEKNEREAKKKKEVTRLFSTRAFGRSYQANGSNAKPMAPTCAESSEVGASKEGAGRVAKTRVPLSRVPVNTAPKVKTTQPSIFTL